MAPRKFDRFMVDVHIASSPKLARLTIAERWTHVAGVLSLAALSPIRGYLLVGDTPASTKDVSIRAQVSMKIAASTLHKLEEVGVLIFDDSLHCFKVHDWDEWNPNPRSDATNAERQARYRERRQAKVTLRNGSVTPAPVTLRNGGVTQGREEKEERTPLPPEGEARVTFNRKAVPAARLTHCRQVLDEFNAQAKTRYAAFTAHGKPTEDLKRVIGAVTSYPDPLDDLEQCRRLIAVTLKRAWWGTSVPSPGVVFGPQVIQKNLAELTPVRRALTSAELVALDTRGRTEEAA